MEHESDGDTKYNSNFIRLILEAEEMDIMRPVEIITALLKSNTIERWSGRIQGTCCHSNSSEKPSDNAGLK